MSDSELTAYPYYFRVKNNSERAKWYKKNCRLIARGKLNTIQVEFECGTRLMTSGNFIRKVRTA